MTINKEKYYRVDTRYNDELIATTYYRPIREDIIELHHEVHKFSPKLLAGMLDEWEKLQVQFMLAGYDKVMTASNDTDIFEKTAKYWTLFGFTDISIINDEYMVGIKYLPMGD